MSDSNHTRGKMDKAEDDGPYCVLPGRDCQYNYGLDYRCNDAVGLKRCIEMKIRTPRLRKGDRVTSAIRHYTDIGYTARVTKNLHLWEFEVFEILSHERQLLWHDNSKIGSPCPVEFLEQAKRFLHGHIRWDGCSNWHFDEQDRVMLHFCDVEQASNIGALFRRLYEWAASEMPEASL